jgi:hypothetical protein
MVDAPWTLRGEAIVAVRRRTVVLAERYVASPVGPYLALGVGRISRVGLRPGVTFSLMVVDNHERLAAGRRNWGLPGEIGTLSWATVGDESALVWHERGVEVRGRAFGRTFPLLAPGRLLQHRGDGPVVVPTRMRGRARRARVEIAVATDDSLAFLNGEHGGLVISGVTTKMQPARVPAGHLWSSRAPAAAPDVATFGSPVRRG